VKEGLKQKWAERNYAEKGQLLEPLGLNFRLDGATLVYAMNKPFDALAEGLIVQSSRGDWTPVELFARLCDESKPRFEPLLAHGSGIATNLGSNLPRLRCSTAATVLRNYISAQQTEAVGEPRARRCSINAINNSR